MHRRQAGHRVSRQLGPGPLGGARDVCAARCRRRPPAGGAGRHRIDPAPHGGRFRARGTLSRAAGREPAAHGGLGLAGAAHHRHLHHGASHRRGARMGPAPRTRAGGGARLRRKGRGYRGGRRSRGRRALGRHHQLRDSVDPTPGAGSVASFRPASRSHRRLHPRDAGGRRRGAGARAHLRRCRRSPEATSPPKAYAGIWPRWPAVSFPAGARPRRSRCSRAWAAPSRIWPLRNWCWDAPLHRRMRRARRRGASRRPAVIRLGGARALPRAAEFPGPPRRWGRSAACRTRPATCRRTPPDRP